MYGYIYAGIITGLHTSIHAMHTYTNMHKYHGCLKDCMRGKYEIWV